MAYITDDPIQDFMRKDAEEQAWYESLPRCGYCDTHIQDEYCYEINGECICEECLNEHHRKAVLV